MGQAQTVKYLIRTGDGDLAGLIAKCLIAATRERVRTLHTAALATIAKSASPWLDDLCSAESDAVALAIVRQQNYPQISDTDALRMLLGDMWTGA